MSPKFDKNNEFWKKVLFFAKFISFPADEAIQMIDMMKEDGSDVDANRFKNIKEFISERDAISSTNPKLFSKFEELIANHGGWLEWKDSVFTVAQNLENPFELLNWLLDEIRSVKPKFIKFEDSKTREQVLNITTFLIENRTIHPLICLTLCKLGNLDFAQKMLPKLLEVVKTNLDWRNRRDEKQGNQLTLSHITGLLQGFGFNGLLCDKVATFIRDLPSHEKYVKIGWSMFFEQSSLKRLRLESTKNIVRFCRLIGCSRNLGDRKLAVLKLVLNVSNFFFFLLVILLNLFLIYFCYYI